VVQRTEFKVGTSRVKVRSTADLNYQFTVHTMLQVVDLHGDGQVLSCLPINLSDLRADFQATTVCTAVKLHTCSWWFPAHIKFCCRL